MFLEYDESVSISDVETKTRPYLLRLPAGAVSSGAGMYSLLRKVA
jgi:hypothetical protein